MTQTKRRTSLTERITTITNIDNTINNTNRNSNTIQFLQEIVRSRRLHDVEIYHYRNKAKEHIDSIRSSPDTISRKFLDKCFDLYSLFRQRQRWLEMTPEQHKEHIQQQEADLIKWIYEEDEYGY